MCVASSSRRLPLFGSLMGGYALRKLNWYYTLLDLRELLSTTRMVDRLAKRFGLPLRETPVGFNYITEYMLNDDVLIGGEESGGLSIKGHIPEGDGVLMGLLLLEIMADAKIPLHELIADIQQEVGPAAYARTDIPLQRPVPKKAMVTRLSEHAPATLAGESIVEVSTLDGVKYILANDSWLLIRPSGTEPVLRVYAEGRSDEEVSALLAFGEEVAEL
jgi:phosphomannomutase